MILPPFRPRIIKIFRGKVFRYAVFLPKLSVKLFDEMKENLEREGFVNKGRIFVKHGKKVQISMRGILKTNFEPSSLLSYILKGMKGWRYYREYGKHGVSRTNDYFTLFNEKIIINPRLNPSRRSYLEYLANDEFFLSLDEAYVVLKLILLSSSSPTFISFKTYDAKFAKLWRKVGKRNFFIVAFDSESFRRSVNDIWEDVLTFRPSFLPFPGTNEIRIEGGDVNEETLSNVFYGLNDWCLSDMHLSRRFY